MTKDEQDIYSRPGHLIRRLQQIAAAFFMAETAEFAITPVQYSALLAVRIHPGIDQTTLAEIIAFDRSTIGEVIKRLEKKGLVRRAVGANDRRTKLLYITPAGHRLLAKLKKAVDAVQVKIVAPLNKRDRATFMRIMRKLVDLNNEHSRVPLQLTASEKATIVRPRGRARS